MNNSLYGKGSGNGLMRRNGGGSFGQCEPENPDFEIQEVFLMPSMKLDIPCPETAPMPEMVLPPEAPKTTFVLQ